MTSSYMLGAIIVMTLVTMATRFAPFLIFTSEKTPPVITYLGKVLPFALMGMLVVFCYKGTNFETIAGWLPGLIAGVIVVAVHLFKRNTLLSIAVGTICYMMLLQYVFV